MEGNYTAHMDVRLPRAEVVIWLDLARRIYFTRALWRSLRNYGRERPDVGPGCSERLDPEFFAGWVWTYPTHSRARHGQLMSSLPAHVRGIVLTTPVDVRALERGLPASVAVVRPN